MLDKDNNLYLTNLSILITCLLDNFMDVILGGVTHESLLTVKG